MLTGNDHEQAAHRALLVLELAAPGDAVAGRQLELLRPRALHLLHEAAHVAVLDEDADRGGAASALAADVHDAFLHADLRHLVQRHLRTVGRVEQQVAQRVDVAALLFAQPHDHVETPLAFPDLGRRPAAERGLDDVLDVGDVQSIAGGAFTVDLDLQLRNAAGAVDEGAADASDRRDELQALRRSSLQHARIRPEHLDDDLAVDLRDDSSTLSRMGCEKVGLMPGMSSSTLLHLDDQLFLGDVRTPLGSRLQIDQHLHHVDRLRIGAVVGAAACETTRDTSGIFSSAARALCRVRFTSPGEMPGWQREVDPDAAFVQLGQELGAELRDQQQGSRPSAPVEAASTVFGRARADLQDRR